MDKRVLVAAVLVLSGCAIYSAHRATARNPYVAPIKAGKDAVISGLLRELATKNLQVAVADRQSGVITVPTIALRPGYFDCDYLLIDGQASYFITSAQGNLQFIVEGNNRASSVRATMQFGLITTVNRYGTQRVGRENCYSTQSLEDELGLPVKRELEKTP